MLLEAAAAALAQAPINRWETDSAAGFFDAHRDAKAVRGAITAAVTATRKDPNANATFGRYDINTAFFDHEGADEIAKLKQRRVRSLVSARPSAIIGSIPIGWSLGSPRPSTTACVAGRRAT